MVDVDVTILITNKANGDGDITQTEIVHEAHLEEVACPGEYDSFQIVLFSSEPLVLLPEGNIGGIPVAMTTLPRP